MDYYSFRQLYHNVTFKPECLTAHHHETKDCAWQPLGKEKAKTASHQDCGVQSHRLEAQLLDVIQNRCFLYD
jgi:hypothetical protein